MEMIEITVVKAMQAVRFFIARIMLHQSLTGHVFLNRGLTVPSARCDTIGIINNSSTTAAVLSFRSGCGCRCFVVQQIGLCERETGKMCQTFRDF